MILTFAKIIDLGVIESIIPHFIIKFNPFSDMRGATR